jgi:hypothetical protein
MKKVILLCLSAALFSACGGNEEGTKESEVPVETPKKTKLGSLNWVLGTWVMETPDGTFTEYWKQTNDSVYTGHGMLVSAKGDTLFSEHIKLEQSGNTVYYKPVVSGQNEGKETVFTEKELNENEVVFENPAHDFPQRIIYKKPSDSTLYARIEGTQNGKSRQEEYQYKKK